MASDRIGGLAEAAEDLSEVPERLGSSLAELADLAAAELLRARPTTERAEARRLGARIAARLCLEVGGTYLPRGQALARAVLHLTIWSEHDGTTGGPNGIRALARRYGLTDPSVWRIIRRERIRHRKPKPTH